MFTAIGYFITAVNVHLDVPASFYLCFIIGRKSLRWVNSDVLERDYAQSINKKRKRLLKGPRVHYLTIVGGRLSYICVTPRRLRDSCRRTVERM